MVLRLEQVRTFLQLSGTHSFKITLLLNDPHNPFNGAPRRASPSYDHNLNLPAPVDESVTCAYLVLIILVQESPAHVHRWREFTSRTTSKTHIRQALVLMSRPSVYPAHMLEKLRLQLVHSQLNINPDHHEPSIFPGSASPINDLFFLAPVGPGFHPLCSHHITSICGYTTAQMTVTKIRLAQQKFCCNSLVHSSICRPPHSN
ncbi:hypothetical protein BDR05DRAFT_963230 [Suillus weaverae]|nr:hypothetical protein BDR05DRAFT_963230 [Suillus weaverae]